MTTQTRPRRVRNAAAGMTHSELHRLPVSVDLLVAARALGMGRTVAYDLAKRGEFPVRVLRLGNRYRVARADLIRFLEAPQETGVA